ncbi:MarR family transcriptional regulator [Sphingomonas colocasiae]|uniref:HTH-type transcriptional regulator n=2 Tax=Sphingomonas colocasiae TaxID=1848973 RepID=A0ABS7PXJ3_9SPHN|nr:MarR family transcriptional regulator [Sphingomonas colocasiae]
MTEIAEKSEALPVAVRQFVLHWGEMGGQWGVNRSVAQIHALLYLSDRPLNADEIGEKLGIARSNISNSLKELLGWKLIRRVPVMGDRREHFEAEVDLWQMLTRIAQGRKEREVDPAVAALKQCRAEAQDDPRISRTARERIEAMHDFVTTMDDWHREMITIPPARLMLLIKMGRKVLNFLPLGRGKVKPDV